MNLLKPLAARGLEFKNRIVHCALTRQRCDMEGMPKDIMIEYYSARVGFSFILTESTPVSIRGNTYPFAGSMWSDEHIPGWKTVVDKVHEKGGLIFM